jgi:type I restriction enzyme S subunit
MLQLTFKQTAPELMVRAASTILFGTLVRKGVKLAPISDLVERPQYGFTASAANEPVGPKLVRITDLQDGRIDWASVPYCECAEPEKYLLCDDDLLFARTGATTGKTHLVRDPEPAVFASYLIRVRPKAGVSAGYLHAFFQSDNYWSQISDEKEGSAQPNVNGEKLAALELPLVDLRLQRDCKVSSLRATQTGW